MLVLLQGLTKYCNTEHCPYRRAVQPSNVRSYMDDVYNSAPPRETGFDRSGEPNDGLRRVGVAYWGPRGLNWTN